MRRTTGFLVLATLGALAVVACDEESWVDPGPFDMDGWIEKCERRCAQHADCSPMQFQFDHGDMDNCLRNCGLHLDTDWSRGFVETSPVECVEALYEDVICVFDLSCDDLDLWEVHGTGYPCSVAGIQAADACVGVDTSLFLAYCGYPKVMDYQI